MAFGCGVAAFACRSTPATGDCQASLSQFADHCEVTTGFSGREGDKLVRGHGSEALACGETKEVCGRAFPCLCEPCDAGGDYDGRWRHGRQVDWCGSASTTHLRVRYEGGECRALVLLEPGCLLAGYEHSTVGGCARDRDLDEHLACGQAADVCGARAFCACDAGNPELIAPVARPAGPLIRSCRE